MIRLLKARQLVTNITNETTHRPSTTEAPRRRAKKNEQRRVPLRGCLGLGHGWFGFQTFLFFVCFRSLLNSFHSSHLWRKSGKMKYWPTTYIIFHNIETFPQNKNSSFRKWRNHQQSMQKQSNLQKKSVDFPFVFLFFSFGTTLFWVNNGRPWVFFVEGGVMTSPFTTLPSSPMWRWGVRKAPSDRRMFVSKPSRWKEVETHLGFAWPCGLDGLAPQKYGSDCREYQWIS